MQAPAKFQERLILQLGIEALLCTRCLEGSIENYAPKRKINLSL